LPELDAAEMKAVPLAIAEAVNLCHMARDWAYGPGEHQVIDRCELLLQMAVDELLEMKRDAKNVPLRTS